MLVNELYTVIDLVVDHHEQVLLGVVLRNILVGEFLVRRHLEEEGREAGRKFGVCMCICVASCWRCWLLRGREGSRNELSERTAKGDRISSSTPLWWLELICWQDREG